MYSTLNPRNERTVAFTLPQPYGVQEHGVFPGTITDLISLQVIFHL